MFDLAKTNLNMLPGSSRLIVQGCLRRGWTVRAFREGSSRMVIDRGDGRGVHIQGSIPPSLGYIAGNTVNHKILCSEILTNHDISQLACCEILGDNNEALVLGYIEKYGQIAVKPVDGSHGDGISVGISDIIDAREALSYAAKSSKTGRVMIQEMFKSELPVLDLRILCIDGRFAGAINRVPARVRGDGNHTIQELIEIENSTFRGEPYKSKFARISLLRAQQYLKDNISRIPADLEVVPVLGIANYGAGGELIDVTDEIPDWLIQHAEGVCHILNLPVAGIDYLIGAAEIASATNANSVIIEVNKGPSLAIHDEPTWGESRGVTEKYLDLIARL